MVVLADRNLAVAFGDIIFGPVGVRIGTAHVFFVDDPRARQSIVNRGDFVMQDIRVGLVAIKALFENRLIVEVQRQAGFIVGPRSLVAPSLVLLSIIGAVAVVLH